MGLNKYLIQIEKRIPLSMYGFILAIAALIYSEFIKDISPKLVFEIKSITKILDVKEEIDNLRIYYGNEDIRSLKQTLSISILNLKNDSNQPILKEYFDEDSPLTIHFPKGKILKLHDDEIKDQQGKRLILSADNKILFPSMIINPQESISLKVLVLHSENDLITPHITGKVAHIRHIETIDLRTNDDNPFWKEVFKGSLLIQALRVFFYPLLSVIFLIIIFLPIIFIGTSISEYKRKKVILAFKSHYANSTSFDLKDRLHLNIFDLYKEYGTESLKMLKKLVENENLLLKAHEKMATLEKNQIDIEDFIISDTSRNDIKDIYYTASSKEESVLFSYSVGKFIIQNKIMEFDPKLIRALEEFLKFIEIKYSN